MAVCPYNSNHRFEKRQFHYHIVKCKEKQKKGHLFRVCKYNSSHIIHKEEIDNHEKNCKDKKDYW